MIRGRTPAVAPDAGQMQANAGKTTSPVATADAHIIIDAGVPLDAEGFIDLTPDAAIVVVDAAPVRRRPDAAAESPAAERKRRADELYQQALRTRRRGLNQAALNLIQQAIEVRKSSVYSAVKADLMLRLKKRVDAIAAANEAIAMGARNASAWLTKAQAHYELAQYGDAKSAFERYLILRPKGNTADEVRIILESL